MWQVYLKELTELLRDKKTLLFVILLPVLIFPVLFGIMGLVMSNVSRQAEAEEHRYVIINAEKAPQFADALFYHKNFKKMTTELRDPAALKQAIRDNQFDLAIVIPADFNPAADNLQQSKWQLIHNSSSQLDMISKHFTELLQTYSKGLQPRHSCSKTCSNLRLLAIAVSGSRCASSLAANVAWQVANATGSGL